jgi:hypothetical protein
MDPDPFSVVNQDLSARALKSEMFEVHYTMSELDWLQINKPTQQDKDLYIKGHLIDMITQKLYSSDMVYFTKFRDPNSFEETAIARIYVMNKNATRLIHLSDKVK